MRAFVLSLKRLYEANKITQDKVIAFYIEGKITEEEKDYILVLTA